MQRLNNPPGLYTYVEALRHLQAQHDKGCKWSKYFKPGRKGGKVDGMIMLVCNACGGDFSAVNASDTMQHATKGRCVPKGEALIRLRQAGLSAGLDAASQPSSSSQQQLSKPHGSRGTMDEFVGTADQARRYRDFMCMFFFTSETPFCRIVNENLIAAAGVYGATLPSEKALRTTYLDRAYEIVKAEVVLEMVRMGPVRTPAGCDMGAVCRTAAGSATWGQYAGQQAVHVMWPCMWQCM